ncbi:MAG: M14 family metallopeptidase [Balneolaceae bacterium]|nr:M14 family metallopeptidase [Balneolaceae bacterium]
MTHSSASLPNRLLSSSLALIFAAAMLLGSPASTAAQDIPTPEEHFGFQIGADYKLASYPQMMEYYQILADNSDRVQMVNIGESTMGRPMVLLIISSEENMQQVDRWRSISEQMSRARIPRQQAEQLAEEGKAVIWLDGGMHATEMAHGQMTSELAWKVATEETPEMQRIRDKVVTLIMPVMNPDGLEIVRDWYNQTLDTPWQDSGPPWLYQKYVGHDNNRDWFMNNMVETQNVNRVLYHEWYPQVVYNHHQTAPWWTRIFLPPFSDPVNPNIHPGVTAGVNMVGSAMSQRFAVKDMPGYISDNSYTMFWNGGGRTAPYYHNMIGILTEVAHPSPTPDYYDPENMPSRVGSGIPTDGTDIFYPDPWQGGESHFRDAVEYMIQGSMAVLDLAAERKTQFLMNIYNMGRDAIEEGEAGNPYAYVIPQEQWDSGEAMNMVNVLIQDGVEIHQADASFSAGDSSYPAGTWVVEASQAYLPMVKDMLEPQNYPTRYQYPGGPPDPPYDLAGWTLPMQMGVEVNRIDSAFSYQGTQLQELEQPVPGDIAGSAGYGYVLSHRPNFSARAMNRLLEAGHTVYWTREAFSRDGGDFEAGSIVIEDRRRTRADVEAVAEEMGLDFHALSGEPDVTLYEVHKPRVGLYKSWDANMDEGWTRWMLKEYEFDVDTLHNRNIRRDDLSQYDAIILPDDSPEGILHGEDPDDLPAKYTGGIELSGMQALRDYVMEGGTLLSFDSASDLLIEQFLLPVENETAGADNLDFFIPGSLIRATVDNSHPLAFGMQPEVAASFSHSRAFSVDWPQSDEGDSLQIDPPPIDSPVRYAEEDLLMSGWALGEQQYLGGESAMLNVRFGEGRLVMYAFRPQFRGQPRGTYKLIFNPLFISTMEEDYVTHDTPVQLPPVDEE